LIPVVSVLSAALQLVYVANLFKGLYSLILIVRDTSFASGGDPKMLAGAISQALMVVIIGAVIGLVGAALAWYVLRRKESRPNWFVSASRTFAFAWMVFVPIGTIVGFLMLRWRKAGNEPQEVS
jgi:magnesium-transporting ATPase (P-type)